MKIKTSELTGAALDWAVAKVEGHQWRCPWLLEKDGFQSWSSYEQAWGNPTPKYSTDWSQGGPILERERIGVCHYNEADGWEVPNWAAWRTDTEDRVQIMGETALIAIMRCFVASKLGDEVDVPEELLR